VTRPSNRGYELRNTLKSVWFRRVLSQRSSVVRVPQNNYAAIIASIPISTALAPALAATSERRSGGDESPAALEQHGDLVTMASWYRPGYEGRRTTNGEIFNSSKLTTALMTMIASTSGAKNALQSLARSPR